MIRTGRFTPYLYLLPFVILLVLVFGYPLVSVFDFSMRRIRVNEGPYIGFANYEQIFKDDVFKLAVQHNALLLAAVPILVVLSLLLAIFLYERLTGWRAYRTILFLPYILAIPIIGVVFGNMFQLNGVINEALRSVGLRPLAQDWIGNPNLALFSIMGMIVWREMGFGIVLFLARLLSLNEELEDAAKVDGAVWWQRRLYVTIPQMRSVIEFYGTISMITMLAWVFSYVYTITRGGPGNATTVLELYMYNFAFRNALPGIASAVAVLLFIVTIVLMIPVLRVRGQREDAR
jgi:raffinose/stachyose/melibiose transport system permease protein